MIGIKVITFLICSLFVKFSRSIDLILPLSDKDASKFIVHQKFLLQQYLTDNNWIYHLTSYESLKKDLIRRVVFHGVELINDTEDHPDDFRRFVLVGLMRDRVLVAVANKQGEVITYQPAFSITENMVVEYIQSPEIIETILTGNPTSNMGVFLSSIFSRRQNKNKREYGDLDSVDDEPYLLRGNSDVSPKRIKKEVDDIIGKKSGTATDLSVPGPSGLKPNSGHSLKEKKDNIPEEQSDSD